MQNINMVTISGNLVKDAELRTTASGTSVLTFSVAVNESRKTSDSEWSEYVNFIDCVLFGARADALSKRMPKGTKVCIAGKLHQSRWEADNGSKRSKIEINVDNIEISPKKESNENENDVQEQLPF